MLLEILKKPTLGHYVRYIECYPRPLQDSALFLLRGPQRNLSDEEMTLLRAAVRRAGFAYEEKLLMNMLMQKEPQRFLDTDSIYSDEDPSGPVITQALTALLISVSPNLVSMALAPPFYRFTDLDYFAPNAAGNEEAYGDFCEGYFCEGFHEGLCQGRNCVDVQFPLVRLFQGANASPSAKPYLQNLQKVYLINSDEGLAQDRYYVMLDFIGITTLFDKLLSIEYVGTDLMREHVDPIPDIKWDESNISKISINHAYVNSTFICHVLARCKAVKEFQYSVGGRALWDARPVFNPKAFIKILCKHMKTMECLDIDTHFLPYGCHSITNIVNHEMSPMDEFDDPLEARNPWGPWEDEQYVETVKFLRKVWEYNGSLRDFLVLKRLSLNVNFLLYFAKGVKEGLGEKQDRVMLVDCLPPSLEYLCIRGYLRGEMEEHDFQIDALMKAFNAGSLYLKEINGVEGMIPDAREVGHPNMEDLMWTLKDAGYETDGYKEGAEDSNREDI
ncbi:uncharacterized protein N7498_006092 [Penicillium cinerascens]|uniref:Uncharacterized protein n=1 Tax=Penicillium cinerascens TaxID=70096 RepID=A0A9W9MHL5_9EURO|nr:uncharacterized protein N7498_006092 [Penicillium cinerascens]KAJ5201429.1 hypothetical protein N7498_006092 [Penicillium cinerascens]